MRNGSPNFVGREEELAEIHTKLQAGQGVIVCAVEGMGGVGKSELALQYATRYQQEYVARYWLSLREMGLAQAVLTMASPYLALPESMQAASLDEQAAWYWQNWLPQEGKVLVILDDVTDLKSIPKQARPLSERFQILVTTRKRKLSPQFSEITLGVISESEALELLGKMLGKPRVEKELTAAKEICEYLGYLPLGVELTGRYLQLDEDLRLSDYRQQLTIADESMDIQEDTGINAPRGVIAAFELSWKELSSNASKVAMMLGLFAPADIAWSLVEEVAPQLNFDAKDLQEGRKQLNNFYLIKAIDDERTRFAIHSLTRQFLQWKLAQEPETNRLFREAFVNSLLALAKQIPSSPTRDLIARVAPAILHLDMLSREMLGDIPNLEEDLYLPFVGIARFYEGQGFYALAEDPSQRCLKVTQELLGERHPYVATSIHNLAVLYRMQGRYKEAEPLFKQAIALSQELLGERHPSVAASLGNLAMLYRSQGRYKEAEPLFKQALALSQELLGERHPDVATGIHNLAMLYRSQGRYKEAEPLYKQAIVLKHELLGKRHPDVAAGINNLAMLYSLQRRYKEAEPLYKLALTMIKELLGDRHPDVATSLNNLAGLYDSQGRYEEAEPLYKQALSLKQELLGDRHPSVAGSLFNLAILHHKMQRHSEAMTEIQSAIQIYEQTLGIEHPHTKAAMSWLPSIWVALNNSNYRKTLSQYRDRISRFLLRLIRRNE
ncbi:tetratricopeptide repeat protein [Pseudanabaena yagii GIHE-NHR1]|uniref:Tetratricopeptide repeat protein n=1 Tax=Pseudanabaena yagii GIHE-NHR1 TaxID=2722753 RepID=A0ABX1M2S6_9CYAN|nr:tetratricopeptide repeat protein [Pseudanabaena yagii GIHE-NHR1]